MPQLDDSAQLEAALERISTIMYTQPDEAITLCEQVFEAARRLNEPLVHVTAAEHYGIIMDHLGRAIEARNVLFEAMQIAQAARLFANEARLLEQIARSHYSVAEYRQAIQYWARCVEVSDQIGGDTRTWILAKIGLGQVYFAINDVASGLALHQDAVSRIHELDDPHLSTKLMLSFGGGLVQSNRHKEAFDVLQQSLEGCLKHDLSDYAADAYLRLAQIEFYLRLAQIELIAGSADQAMAYLEAGLLHAKKVNFHWCETALLAVQADVYALRGDYAAAMKTIKEAQSVAVAGSFSPMLIQQHFAASRYAKAMGDLATALEEHEQGHDRERRMMTESSAERIVELEEKTGLRPSINRLLIELSNNHLIEEGQLDPAFRLITQEGSRILGVERASVWLLDRETGTLVCRCLCLAGSDGYARETAWRRKDHVVYFERLSDPNPIVAHDALHHPHMVELGKSYFPERDIRSVLIFPIRIASNTVGMISFEAVKSRRNWTLDDILHGNQLMEVAARVVSTYERQQFQEQIEALNAKIMQANEMLEQRVMEKTVSMEKYTVELHELQNKLFEMKQKLTQLEANMASASESGAGAQ